MNKAIEQSIAYDPLVTTKVKDAVPAAKWPFELLLLGWPPLSSSSERFSRTSSAVISGPTCRRPGYGAEFSHAVGLPSTW